MIINAHRDIQLAIVEHREDEIEQAKWDIVETARACGVAQAFLDSHGGDPAVTMTTIENAFMKAWFLEGFVVKAPAGGPARSKPFLDALDLAPLWAAVERKNTLEAKIMEERQDIRLVDHEDIDRSTISTAVDLPSSVLRFSDGAPRPAFHATVNFEFERLKAVSHFGTAIAAARHAENISRFSTDPVRIVQVWLDVRRPLILDDGGHAGSFWVLDAMDNLNLVARPALDLLKSQEFESRHDADRAIDALIHKTLAQHGYDAIQYRNNIEGGGFSWVTTSDAQIFYGETWHFAFGVDAGTWIELPHCHDRPTMVLDARSLEMTQIIELLGEDGHAALLERCHTEANILFGEARDHATHPITLQDIQSIHGEVSRRLDGAVFEGSLSFLVDFNNRVMLDHMLEMASTLPSAPNWQPPPDGMVYLPISAGLLTLALGAASGNIAREALDTIPITLATP